GVKVDNKQYFLILDEDEADNLAENITNYQEIKAIYVAKDVLFTTKQQMAFSEILTHTIPDYYFEFELREEGQAW
ncbi:MAG: site-specific DNA-methyltransferase, partial [Oscillospiraceae bacterium]|nr:site-specific DNA-methyltransferase [Oscillospiraceae bacterium]